MAFHAKAFSVSLVVTWCTTSPGDDVYCLVSQDGGAGTFTPPVSGNWTALGAVQHTLFDGQDAQLFHFSGNGGNGAPSSPPATETWTSTGGVGTSSAVMMSFSGRKIGSTSYATQTKNDASNTPPFTAALNGGTSTTGDDIFVVVAFDPNNPVATTTMSTTGSPGTFSNQGTTDGGSSINPIGLSTINNVASGASGTLSAAWTDTNDTATAWMGWVVAIKASASSFPVFMSSSN